MLTAYIRMSQEGIESLPNSKTPIKDESGHYFFDDFRAAIFHHRNIGEKTSGIGLLSFGPNGTIWSQAGEYCFEGDELYSIFVGLDAVFKEAEKSKVKTVEIFLNNKEIINFITTIHLQKEKRIKDVYKWLQKTTKPYKSIKFTHRTKFPKSVKDRLKKDAMAASKPPEFSPNGRWNNASNKSYYNIGATKEDMKEHAKQYAHIMYDFMQSYLKEYKTDYGKEKLNQLIKQVNDGGVKDLPPTKRNIKEKKSVRKISKYKPIQRKILCHNCGEVMVCESCHKHMPENKIVHKYRCKKCLATKKLKNGRTIIYGRYPKK